MPEAFGPYLVYEQLGIGGMAEVHRAEQSGIEGFRKLVALKRMLPHIAADEEMVRSFVREAKLAAFLRHANVPQTYELGKVGRIYSRCSRPRTTSTRSTACARCRSRRPRARIPRSPRRSTTS